MAEAFQANLWIKVRIETSRQLV